MLYHTDCLLQLNYTLSKRDGVVSVVPLVFRKTFESVLAAKLVDTGSIGGLQGYLKTDQFTDSKSS